MKSFEKVDRVRSHTLAIGIDFVSLTNMMLPIIESLPFAQMNLHFYMLIKHPRDEKEASCLFICTIFVSPACDFLRL